MKLHLNAALSAAVAMALAAVASAASNTYFSEDFNSNPTRWTTAGRGLFQWNAAAGNLSATWDQLNQYDYMTTPQTIVPTRYTSPLGRTLTDNDSFRVNVTLKMNSVVDTTEMFQVANFGLYNVANMGADRTMSDNDWNNYTSVVKDGSDFVEFGYYVMNKSYGWNPATVATIGTHIDGTFGNYVTGDGSDPRFHQTDMGADNYLPTNTNLYVELKYDASTRRASTVVYSDAAHSQMVVVNGVGQYYTTAPMGTSDHFTVTDVGFWNYVGNYWGGTPGYATGSFDDITVGALPAAGDANDDGKVDVLDLGILATNWQKTNVGWGGGDFNGDGVVDVLDLGILATNWQGTAGSFADAAAAAGLMVPEPATMAIVIMGGAALIRRRK